jgi:protoheme ferro-lyase
MNIYRIWILYKEIMISMKDVTFDENIFYNKKIPDWPEDLISELDTLIKKVRMLKAEIKNEAILWENDDILETDTELTGSELEDKLVQDFNQAKDLKLAKAMEEAYVTPSQMDDEDNESLCILYFPYQYK